MLVYLMTLAALLEIKSLLYTTSNPAFQMIESLVSSLSLSALASYLVKYSLCYPQQSDSLLGNPVTLLMLYSLSLYSGIELPSLAHTLLGCACLGGSLLVYGQLRIRYDKRPPAGYENNGYKLLM